MVSILYNIIVLESSIFFYVIYDLVTCDRYVTVIYNIILIPNFKSKNNKIKNKNKNK